MTEDKNLEFALHASPGVFSNKDVRKKILNYVLENPFCKPMGMDYGSGTEFDKEVDIDWALEYLQSNSNPSLKFYSEEEGFFWVTIGQHADFSHMSFTINWGMVRKVTLVKTREYFRGLIALIPGFQFASIGPDEDYKDLNEEQGIPSVSNVFHQQIAWLHFLHPRAYDQYFTAEVLKKAPFSNVIDLPDGIHEMESYADLFSFETAENLGKVKAIAEYINENTRLREGGGKESIWK